MFQNKSLACVFICLSIIFSLIGCVSEKTEAAQTELDPTTITTVTATPFPTLPPTKTFTPKPSTTPTPTQSASPSPTPKFTPTKIVSPTPKPTLAPSPTPTLEPVEFLVERNPTIDNLEAYLIDTPDGYFKTTSSDREYLINAFRDRGLTAGVELIYDDVNGDGATDMIVTDELAVAIFLWSDNHYSAPFIMIGSMWKYAPSSKVTLEDWTNDGIPEIVFMYRGDAGGTGIKFNVWYRFIITCKETKCHEIWTDRATHVTDDYNFGGMTLLQSKTELLTGGQDGLYLEQTTEGFSIYDSDFTPQFWSMAYADSRSEFLKVFTTTSSIYAWNGESFDFVGSRDISDSYVIEQNSSHLATNESDTASIIYESNHWLGQLNDVCQAYINEEPLGSTFGCKGNFTSIGWENIVGDEQPEIIIRALSGKRPYDLDYNLMADISCMHQRYIIYQWDGENAVEVANVAGCVVQSDLYGIKMTDIDKDGQFEIVAASSWYTESDCYPEPSYSCWYEFGHKNDVYRWNGSKFVFWYESQDDID